MRMCTCVIECTCYLADLMQYAMLCQHECVAYREVLILRVDRHYFIFLLALRRVVSLCSMWFPMCHYTMG